MSRLIDVDALINYLGFDNTKEEREENIGEIVTLEDFDRQPTAFDVDKVVKQLDKASDYYEFDEQGKEHVQMINLAEALDIVKGGGAE